MANDDQQGLGTLLQKEQARARRKEELEPAIPQLSIEGG
jgi:hypothetical protein